MQTPFEHLPAPLLKSQTFPTAPLRDNLMSAMLGTVEQKHDEEPHQLRLSEDVSTAWQDVYRKNPRKRVLTGV